jgi:MFS family permease
VPESPIKTPSRVDVPGAVLLSAGLVTLLLAISEGSSWGWGSATIVGLFVASAASFALWVLVELRVPEPLIDMHVFAERPVLLTNTTAVLTGFSMFGSFVLVPNLLQLSPDVAPYGLGASSTATGIYLLPSAITGIFAGPAASVIARRYGAKVPLSLGLAIGAAGVAMIAIWHDRPWQIVVGMLITGSGVPMAFAAMASLIVQSVRPSETGVAGGINTVMRTVGGVIGGQAGAAILAADTIGRSNVPAESAFTAAFAAAAAAALLGSLIALWVTPIRRARAVPVYER